MAKKPQNNQNPSKIGNRKVKNKVAELWCEEDLLNAIPGIHCVPGISICGAAKKHGVRESMNRWRQSKNGQLLQKPGQKCILSKQEEAELKKIISTVCDYRFKPSEGEIEKLVGEYVAKNGINGPQFNNRIPGRKVTRKYKEKQ